MMDRAFHKDLEEIFRFSRLFGLKEALWGIDYHRTLEYLLALRCLDYLNHLPANVLDIGTGKHSIFPFYIAAKYHVNVRATDIRIDFVESEKKTPNISQ